MYKTKEDRRREAIERDLARDNRTTDEQLALIRQRPGASAKEKARLLSGSPSEADIADEMSRSADEVLYAVSDAECQLTDDGYHDWLPVAGQADMYVCRACGLIDC